MSKTNFMTFLFADVRNYLVNHPAEAEAWEEINYLVEEKNLRKLHNCNNLTEINNSARYKEIQKKLNNIQTIPPNRIKKLDPISYPNKLIYSGYRKPKKLSALPCSKESGVELVPLILAKQQNYPSKFYLRSTDVTNNGKYNSFKINNPQKYLSELNKQMFEKQQKNKEFKLKETEIIRRHFSTWDSFWGRPGNSAPKSSFKKQRLDCLLYPQHVPISVH